MSNDFKEDVDNIKKSITYPINPDVYNLKNSMCFKTWNDIIISLPQRTVKWCCKTSYTEKQQEQIKFDIDTLNLDFLINHPVLQQRKYDLSGGTRSKDCVGCWVSEDAGKESVRTQYNRNFTPHWKHRLDNSSNHPKKSVQFHQHMVKRDAFNFIEIELTNKCNMACAYCWEGSSTRWQKETGRRMPDTDDAIFTKVIDILNEYWETRLKDEKYIEFSLLGGEPFFTDHMYQFIEDFVVNLNDTKQDDQRVVITVTTSLNFPKKKFEKFIELVERTPNIEYMMQLSGEAVGKRSELIRWGLNWDTWDSNLGMFLDEGMRLDNIIIGFGCAHNSLSLPYFKDYLIHIDKKIKDHGFTKNIYMHTNWVDYPTHLAVRMIDPKHADTIQDIMDYFMNDFYENVYKKDRYLDVMSTIKSQVEMPVTAESKAAARFTFNELTTRRKISFIEHFPHYNELIDDTQVLIPK